MQYALLFFAATSIGQINSKPDPRCGSLCLYVALKSFGLPPQSYKELEQSLGTPFEAGYSILQLENEARKRGASSIAVETSLANLTTRNHKYKENFACIALVNPNHFVLLYDSDDKFAFIVDPLKSYTLPVDTFRSTWSGKVLLVGKNPFRNEEELLEGSWFSAKLLALIIALLSLCIVGFCLVKGFIFKSVRKDASTFLCLFLGCTCLFTGCDNTKPGKSESNLDNLVFQKQLTGLRIATREVDLGDYYQNSPSDTLETITSIENLGPYPVSITSVKAGCSCTTVELDRPTLSPNGTTNIKTIIKVGNTSEPRRTSITINTDDRKNPSYTVTFTWRVRDLLETQPPSFKTVQLQAWQKTVLNAKVIAHGGALCKNCQVVARSNNPSIIPILHLQDFDRNEFHRKYVKQDETQVLGFLSIELQADSISETKHDSVDLIVTCNGVDRCLMKLPVDWAVKSPMEILPSRLFLGKIKAGEETKSSVFLKHNDQNSFRILELHTDNLFVEVNSEYDENSRTEHNVNLRFKSSALPGLVRSTLYVKTDYLDGRTFMVPFSYISY